VLRIVAPIEASTYMILVLGAIGRIFFDGPDIAPMLGPIHGMVFLGYFAATFEAKGENDWDLRRTVLILFAAVIPLGGYFVGERLIR
jgi:integral membrane protein